MISAIKYKDHLPQLPITLSHSSSSSTTQDKDHLPVRLKTIMVLTLWSVRSKYTKASNYDLERIYQGISNYFTLKIHHGGIFTKKPWEKGNEPVMDDVPVMNDEPVMTDEPVMNDKPIIDNEPVLDDEYDFFDDEPLIDEVEVNMINLCSVLDEDIDLGQLDLTNNNTMEHEDIEYEPLEVLDNDVFKSFASEQEPRKKLLKSILKPIACSSSEVHTKAFKIGQTFKEKEKIKEAIANYSVKEMRDLHYVKNDKIRIRVKCRGIVP
ncbi:unnamed protein product [Lactuca saligna]|uniref:Transposase MuDR plant domain-containing protein n=1 Tax=Lactuca saligna TaxID=75948 RepID=A0AA36E094_LACSI|nr:unnamed protein product [Lactuca saligna]